MKTKSFFFLLTIFGIVFNLSAQTVNDTILAFTIRGNINSFSFDFPYTFSKRKFELNQDSLSLYEMSQNNPKLSTLKGWSDYTDYSEKYDDNLGWHPGTKVTPWSNSGDIGIHQYVSGVGNYSEAKNDNDIIRKMVGRIMVVTEVWGTDTYLLFHKTIKPKEILLIRASSDQWSFPAMTRYEKPKTEMKLLSDSLTIGIEPSKLIILEKLINNRRLVKPIPTMIGIQKSFVVVKEEEILPSIPKLTVNPISDSKKISVSEGKNTILLYDHANVDGDVVSIYINDILFKDDVLIKSAPLKIPFISKNGPENKIEIIVKSEGKIPPCTVTMRSKSKNGQTVRMNGKKGEKMVLILAVE